MARRLYRSSTDRMISGVAAGLAEYLAVDPVLVRIAFVFATFASGLGIISYLVLSVVLPRKPWHMVSQGSDEPIAPPRSQQRPAFWFGLILVGVGIVAAIGEFLPWFDLDTLWPVVLIILGAGLVYRSVSTAERAPL